ncbi:transcriptional regulator of RNA polII, SAGA, subunit-domain-containing protein [Thelephora terrestris]|uniref:Transcriptional regulator of RNA polII, SAGA, subunit-domain-containing protein n=1 Tax=Thelephora terrestris TaxID=56493 RepID=A0A9P6HMG9_9AGAM|nr:transcriptional regulator of RNA polII, SAGA, subunit-domain-containing protein [Thelephora terrestris]
MSLASTGNIKTQLTIALGDKGAIYFSAFQQYLKAAISRQEFEDQMRDCLDTPHLLQLHNSLVISLFDITSHLKPQPPAPPPPPKPAPRKRRRTLPYQSLDGSDQNTLRSARLKKWTLSIGRRERERVKAYEDGVPSIPRPLRGFQDEIAQERGVVLISERNEPPGTRPHLHFASVTRAPTLQHVWDRMNLISAQHNLSPPSKQAASLMMLAFETKIKQMIMQAITLTTTSQAITSIAPSTTSHRSHVLTASAFDSLFTICPAVLPYKSAAALRFALGDSDTADDDHLPHGREVRDQRWQIFGLLSERSTVKQAIRNLG